MDMFGDKEDLEAEAMLRDETEGGRKAVRYGC